VAVWRFLYGENLRADFKGALNCTDSTDAIESTERPIPEVIVMAQKRFQGGSLEVGVFEISDPPPEIRQGRSDLGRA